MAVLLVLLALPGGSQAAAPRIAIPSCTQQGPCVVIEVLDGNGRVGDLHEIAGTEVVGEQADVRGVTYPVQGGSATTVEKGSSLSRLLSTVVDPSTVTWAEVVWDDAYQRHLLTGAELQQGAAAGFEGGLVPAFYSTDPQGAPPERLNYIRPQREPDEANGAPGPDQGTMFTGPRGAFLVRAHLTGQVLDVGVTATATDEGSRTYALATDRSSDATSYDWVLPDGSRSDVAAPTFTFPAGTAAGSYPASVGVTTADGSFGWGTADLRAGPPATQPPTPTASATGTGGRGKAKKGPDDNPSATASADPDPGPTGGTAAAQPSAAPTAPADSPGDVGSVLPRPSDTATSPAPAPVDDGSLTGILLAGAQPIDPGGGVVADTRSASPSSAALGATPFRVATVVWVVGGGMLLFLAGVASESGAGLPRVRGAVREWRRKR